MWGEIKRHRHFYLFIAPFFILFAIFGLYPLLFSLYLSFVKWDGLTPMRWVGLGNFVVMLEDEILLTSLWNTSSVTERSDCGHSRYIANICIGVQAGRAPKPAALSA